MLSDLAITVELVGTCTQLKASCSRMQLQIHYHDLFVPSAVDSLCPAVVAPLLAFFLWMYFKFYNGLQWPECICGAIVMNFTGQSAASSWFSHGREDSMDWSSWSKFPLCYARLWSTTVGDNLKMQWHVYAVQFEENFYRCASKLRLLISIISSAFRVAACLRWLISLYRSIFVSLVLGWNLNILSSLMGDPDISTWTKVIF